MTNCERKSAYSTTAVFFVMAGFSAFQSAALCSQKDGPYSPLMPAGTGYVSSRSCAHDPSSRTQQPIVTGTAVLGLKFKDGVMLAADTLGQSAVRISMFNI